jgi:hypothetical protein
VIYFKENSFIRYAFRIQSNPAPQYDAASAMRISENAKESNRRLFVPGRQ